MAHRDLLHATAGHAADFLDSLGLGSPLPLVQIVLPIGISFYTFMTISYVIDVYRRDIQPTRNFIDFALFVSYFPHLVAGPILRASLLIPQIARPRVITQGQIVDGLWLTGWGLFQKMFVADNLAPFDITESESLLFGRDFGVGTDIETGPNGNLFVVSLSHGAIYEISRIRPERRR